MDFLFMRGGKPVIFTVADDLEVTERQYEANADLAVSINLTAANALTKVMMTSAFRRQAEALRAEGSEATATENGIILKKSSHKSNRITAFLLQVSTDPGYNPRSADLRDIAADIRQGLDELRKGSCPACQQNEFLRGFRPRVGAALDAGGIP